MSRERSNTSLSARTRPPRPALGKVDLFTQHYGLSTKYVDHLKAAYDNDETAILCDLLFLVFPEAMVELLTEEKRLALVRSRVAAFYEYHNPAKLNDIPHLLDAYKKTGTTQILPDLIGKYYPDVAEELMRRPVGAAAVDGFDKDSPMDSAEKPLSAKRVQFQGNIDSDLLKKPLRTDASTTTTLSDLKGCIRDMYRLSHLVSVGTMTATPSHESDVAMPATPSNASRGGHPITCTNCVNLQRQLDQATARIYDIRSQQPAGGGRGAVSQHEDPLRSGATTTSSSYAGGQRRQPMSNLHSVRRPQRT